MLRLLWWLIILVAGAYGLARLADIPGSVSIDWLGQETRLSVFAALVIVASLFIALLFVVWLLRKILKTPAAIGQSRRARKTRRAYEALSRGIIAAGAGDAQAAARHAALAGDTLKHEPLVKLLGAQTAQLRGDKAGVRSVFEEMSTNPDTALLGLRGLFAHARDQGDWHGARKHAEAALARNSRLPWAAQAVLQALVVHKDWEGAAAVIANQAREGLMAKPEASKKQAALLCAAALAAEPVNKAKALALADQAHRLDPALVPAACAIARIQNLQGQARRAAKALRTTYGLNPHRDLAFCMAHGGDVDVEAQFERVRELTGKEPAPSEGRIALATAAFAAGRIEAARAVLKPLAENVPVASTCALMAEIEEADGDKAKAHAWLARAVNAPRDPMWVCDGVASVHWVPVSPVTSEIVPCEWKSPFEMPLQAAIGFTPRMAPAPKLVTTAVPGNGNANNTGPKTSALPPAPDDPGVAQDS